MAVMLFEFQDFPKEREIIGRLLIAYGEIEFALMDYLAATLGSDGHMVTRVLFRVKGESARIEVADALIRPAFAKIGLDGKWGNAIGAIRLCKNIRNQYAHCHWQVLNGVLRFMDLDTMAESTAGPVTLDLIRLELSLLDQESSYFEYALARLIQLGGDLS
jgi:hypothetical protein